MNKSFDKIMNEENNEEKFADASARVAQHMLEAVVRLDVPDDIMRIMKNCTRNSGSEQVQVLHECILFLEEVQPKVRELIAKLEK